MKRSFTRVLMATLILTGTSMAGPNVLFEDDFNAEVPGEGLVPTNWVVFSGTVDIVDDGSDGAYIDLNGTSGTPGWLATKAMFLLEAGRDYLLTFDLAGNGHDGTDQVQVSTSNTYGALWSTVLAWDQEFGTYSVPIRGTGAECSMIICNTADGDSYGPKLDNVLLAEVAPCVPAPGALLLGSLGTGLAAAWFRRRSASWR